MSKIEQSLQQARSGLKKINAGGGEVTGNYWFALLDGGKSAHIVVTLSIKDKSGQKAIKGGKGLFKKAKPNHVSWGTVTLDAGKLTFDMAGNNDTASGGNKLPKGKFTSGLRKILPEAHKGFSFLKGAKIKSPDGEVEEAGVATTGEMVSDLQLSEAEQAELADILADQSAIAEANKALGAMLKKVSAERQDQIQDQLVRCFELSRQEPLDKDALLDAQNAIAGLMHTGKSPWPEVGGTLDEAGQILMQGATGGMIAALNDLLSKYKARLKKIEAIIDRELSEDLKDEVDEDSPISYEQYVEIRKGELSKAYIPEIIDLEGRVDNVVNQLKTIPVPKNAAQ
ncbi:MAG: hypothetical protein AAFV53_25215 [Myxococcota bacterium]